MFISSRYVCNIIIFFEGDSMVYENIDWDNCT